MDGRRARRAANEANQDAVLPVEDGEVPQNDQEAQPPNLMAVALAQLNSSAALLGFSPDDIQAFLQMRLPVEEMQEQDPIANAPLVINDYVPPQRVRDPSLSKTIENSAFDLKGLIKDKFSSSSKQNKERFERLDKVLIHNGLYTMAKKTRLIPTITATNPYGQS